VPRFVTGGDIIAARPQAADEAGADPPGAAGG
jgi:hypothetical protein